jgi:2-oxo-4-hydroxy-4-carboxy--5-ureidoimidazoline (OHCU) decarboxylase
MSDLNQLSESSFGEALRPLFEAAGPLLTDLYAARPFRSYDELLDAAEATALSLPREKQIEVVNAHPRIGANPTAVSEQSYREQGYEAERALAAADLSATYARLQELNDEYERRFGFRFVVFVNRRPKGAIVEVLEERMKRSPDQELVTALREMMQIARDRLATSRA